RSSSFAWSPEGSACEAAEASSAADPGAAVADGSPAAAAGPGAEESLTVDGGVAGVTSPPLVAGAGAGGGGAETGVPAAAGLGCRSCAAFTRKYTSPPAIATGTMNLSSVHRRPATHLRATPPSDSAQPISQRRPVPTSRATRPNTTSSTYSCRERFMAAV